MVGDRDSNTAPPAVPSSLVERLNAAVARWTRVVPLSLQPEFRREFEAFGAEYERTMRTIETIWVRREQRYAFDESTGLARRKPFHDHLAAVLMTPASPVLRAVGVLFIDVDNLKAVNDTFGHAAGDRAVAAIGAIIRDAIRVDLNTDFMARSERGGEYAVSRHGGDEFLVALELKDPEGIDVVASRIKSHADDTARQRAHGYDAPKPISVSVGGVLYRLTDASPAMPAHALAAGLITAADEQMYAAKRDRCIYIVSAAAGSTLAVDFSDVRRISRTGRVDRSPRTQPGPVDGSVAD
jgi:diguanylate cyclase (GGDEF)-like protein